MDYNKTKSIIEQKFNPNDGYDIEIFFDYDDIISFTIYRDGEECLFLKFHEKFIRIPSLHKCGINPGTTSGSILLQKIHEIAKQIPGISYIELFDFSEIRLNWISIDLAFLKILTTGRSWYNSFGYVSVNYKTELEDNEKLRNENLIKILRESFGIQFIREVTNLYLYLNELFSEKNIIPIDQITIKKFFEYINRLGEIKFENVQNVLLPETQKRKLDNVQNVLLPETKKRKLDNVQNVLHPETQKRKLDNLQNVLNKEQITTLKHLIDIIGLKINYNRNLIKTITCNNSYCIMMGGKTTKQKTKKQKTKNKKTKNKKQKCVKYKHSV
jgi:hypothetical protein